MLAPDRQLKFQKFGRRAHRCHEFSRLGWALFLVLLVASSVLESWPIVYTSLGIVCVSTAAEIAAAVYLVRQMLAIGKE